MMAALAKYIDDNSGSITTGGSSTAYTVTSNQVFDSLANMSGQSIRVKMHVANGAAPTLNVDGLGAKAIVTVTGTAVGTGALLINTVYEFVYSNSSSEWLLVGGASPLGGFASGTVMLFVQTAAPTGWTKGSTHDNKALRLVTGTAGTGGSTAFTSVFAARTIVTANLPAYTPTGTIGSDTLTMPTRSITSTTGTVPTITNAANQTTGNQDIISTFGGSATSIFTGTAQGGVSTAMDFAVQYIDVILATKD